MICTKFTVNMSDEYYKKFFNNKPFTEMTDEIEAALTDKEEGVICKVESIELVEDK